ncbi:autotransporter strand-loop-strand O-heptosyltransferase [Candidatus Pantoea multigeneris]|uniref:Autotransporter strand-loop-strand O-heptosyltransferase n=1 Tax=Candidatus Pantoea multigeneris TaxID=2608357 RepID=A0ABX0R8D5_9GAMM|nr:autotransporter strand-loop-strand O-heptosyltransferase [Pantoea multigeneris]NIF20561.1 autotransporter strand-loop-strand O-heptosyltransferase [Pantoea multigeneris]
MSFFTPNNAAFPSPESRPQPEHVEDSVPESSYAVASDSDFKKSPYAPVPELPTQQGAEGTGILFDFNHGCRIHLPEGNWRVRVVDIQNYHVFGDTAVSGGMVESKHKYYVPFAFQVQKDNEIVMLHVMDLYQQPVLIQIPEDTLGDTLAWLPSVMRFQVRHQCRLTVRVSARFHDVFASSYPQIRFIDPYEPDETTYYATYFLNAGIGDTQGEYCPVDGQQTPLHHIASAILGLAPDENPAQFRLAENRRPIAEPYVCIGVQSTSQCKFWNNPVGWIQLVRELKERGYRVICIDKETTVGRDLTWNHIPHGAEDETGNRPLSERLRWLMHAEFFVGLSSGLSWLAWTAGTPVVMISGFSNPATEFATPYRVTNTHVCNSCWNDTRYQFDRKDFFWCPRHKGTSEQFSCSKFISVEQVLGVMAPLPGIHPDSVIAQDSRFASNNNLTQLVPLRSATGTS